MTTFNITNIVPDLQLMRMTVFYSFSNGHVFSNTVPANTGVQDILSWGQDKCNWFDQREIRMEEMRHQLLEHSEEIITE